MSEASVTPIRDMITATFDRNGLDVVTDRVSQRSRRGCVWGERGTDLVILDEDPTYTFWPVDRPCINRVILTGAPPKTKPTATGSPQELRLRRASTYTLAVKDLLRDAHDSSGLANSHPLYRSAQKALTALLAVYSEAGDR